jgi:hypothetical protein
MQELRHAPDTAVAVRTGGAAHSVQRVRSALQEGPAAAEQLGWQGQRRATAACCACTAPEAFCPGLTVCGLMHPSLTAAIVPWLLFAFCPWCAHRAASETSCRRGHHICPIPCDCPKYSETDVTPLSVQYAVSSVASEAWSSGTSLCKILRPHYFAVPEKQGRALRTVHLASLACMGCKMEFLWDIHGVHKI